MVEWARISVRLLEKTTVMGGALDTTRKTITTKRLEQLAYLAIFNSKRTRQILWMGERRHRHKQNENKSKRRSSIIYASSYEKYN